MSEEFYATPESVAWLRGMMLANPHPQAPAGFQRQLDACGGTTCAIESAERFNHAVLGFLAEHAGATAAA